MNINLFFIKKTLQKKETILKFIANGTSLHNIINSKSFGGNGAHREWIIHTCSAHRKHHSLQ